MPKPVIDYKKCTNCGNCVDICPMQVFEKENDKVVVKHPDKCIGCFLIIFIYLFSYLLFLRKIAPHGLYAFYGYFLGLVILSHKEY